ncbi:hypothetical protein RFI_00265 [Reticulomyxa filosa]|uniref:Ubiquitin-like domain-containing protein n=1 Tax=Reticulomyxa filosa TaxID=46433 RepID=X6PGI3_RETFI|nr:hypothetical protein RFI_00265 [Reticulomyxa filosa]|eukprot:ETO36797.1 hypothetical protein RFI_00265 [Reticulomyxa filosa]
MGVKKLSLCTSTKINDEQQMRTFHNIDLAFKLAIIFQDKIKWSIIIKNFKCQYIFLKSVNFQKKEKRTYLCSVQMDDEIQVLKNMIYDVEGVAPHLQTIQYGGKHLSSKHQFRDYFGNSYASPGGLQMVLLSLHLPLKGGSKPNKKTTTKKNKTTSEEELPMDTFDTMNAEELKQTQSLLQTALSKGQEKRAFFQLERDQIHKMYTIAHEKCKESENQIKNMEADMEYMRSNHRNNIRVTSFVNPTNKSRDIAFCMYVEKVKHLEYDHQNTLNAVTLEMSTLQDEECKQQKQKQEKLVWQKVVLQQGIELISYFALLMFI